MGLKMKLVLNLAYLWQNCMFIKMDCPIQINNMKRSFNPQTLKNEPKLTQTLNVTNVMLFIVVKKTSSLFLPFDILMND